MAKSIIQKKNGEGYLSDDNCYLCGRRNGFGGYLDKHHVFFGPYRKKSEKYGLTVKLCHYSCHLFGPYSVHGNAEVCRELQAEVQKIAMRHYGWSISDFIKIFGKNYVPVVERNNRCVMCGAIIPEGRQVCVNCEGDT